MIKNPFSNLEKGKSQPSHNPAEAQQKLKEALEKIKSDDPDGIQELKNIMGHEAISEDLKTAMDPLNATEHNKIFKTLLEESEFLAAENLGCFKGLGHETLNSLLKTRKNDFVKQINKEGNLGVVFDMGEIKKKIGSRAGGTSGLEKSFNAYYEESSGSYNFKKAVTELTDIGVSKDAFRLKKDILISILDEGHASWVEKNHDVFEMTGKEKKELLSEADHWESLVRAGFTKDLINEVFPSTKEGSIKNEVLEEIKNYKPEQEMVEGLIDIAQEGRFEKSKEEVTVSLIEWVANEEKTKKEGERKKMATAIIGKIDETKYKPGSLTALTFIDSGFSDCVKDHLKKYTDLTEGVGSKIIKEENGLDKIVELEARFEDTFSEADKLVNEVLTEATYELSKVKDLGVGKRLTEGAKRITRGESLKRVDEGLKEKIDRMLTEGTVQTGDFSIRKEFGEKLDGEDVERIRNYIRAKRIMEGVMGGKMEKIAGSEKDEVEDLAKMMVGLEEMNVMEEVKLKERAGTLGEKVKKGWYWFKDANLDSRWNKEGKQAKNKFTAMVRRMVSLKTVTFGALAAATLMTGGAGGAALWVTRKGLRALIGASAGHDAAKGWMNKSIRDRMEAMVKTEKGDISFNEVIDLKKEYDEFAKEHHSREEREEVTSTSEYQEFLELYKDKIMEFCKNADGDVEAALKEKLSGAGVRARSKIRRGKRKILGAEAAGMTKSFIMPGFVAELWDAAPDTATNFVEKKAGGLVNLVNKAKTFVFGGEDAEKSDANAPGKSKEDPQTTEPSKKADLEPSSGDEKLSQGSEENLNGGTGPGSGVVHAAEGPPTGAVEDPLLTEEEPEPIEWGAGKIVVNGGVYEVQAGNTLSQILENEFPEEHDEILEKLRGLEGEDGDEFAKALKEMGISSGDVDEINVGEKIDINELKKLVFTTEGVFNSLNLGSLEGHLAKEDYEKFNWNDIKEVILKNDDSEWEWKAGDILAETDKNEIVEALKDKNIAVSVDGEVLSIEVQGISEEAEEGAQDSEEAQKEVSPDVEQAEETEEPIKVDEPYTLKDEDDIIRFADRMEEMGGEELKFSEEFKNFTKALKPGEEVILSGEGEDMTIEIHDSRGSDGGPVDQIRIFERILEGEHILEEDSKLSEVIKSYSKENENVLLGIEGGKEVPVNDIKMFRPDALKESFPQGSVVEVEEGEKILIRNGDINIDPKSFDPSNINTETIGRAIEHGEFSIKMDDINKELQGLLERAEWTDEDSAVQKNIKKDHVERFIDALTFDVVESSGAEEDLLEKARERLENARGKMVNTLFEDNCEGLKKLINTQSSLDKREFIQLSYSAEDESMAFEKSWRNEVQIRGRKRISKGIRDIISTE